MASERRFEDFYAASYGRLVGQLVPVTGNLEEAEDVCQEAFARAAVRWNRLRDFDAPEAWVRRVALNLAANALRRGRRRVAALVRLRPPAEAPAASPEVLDFLAALQKLSLGQRQALVLHHVVGLSVEEVARQLGVPAGTVKARLSRGRAALARRLGLELEGGRIVSG
jgi:RNA polymerase sigma-70 factor (ECF subfamily)